METTPTRPMTLDEYEALPGTLTEYMEVVRGQLAPKNAVNEKGEIISPGAKHSGIQLRLGALLLAWARRGDQGFAGTEAGYVIRWDPFTVRIPDVSFLSSARRPAGDEPDGNWPLAPDFAVEIVSPTDYAYEVRAKVADYLDAGVALVWTVWPKTREVTVYASDAEPRTYREGDALEFPQVLPGFSCKVEELFAQDNDI